MSLRHWLAFVVAAALGVGALPKIKIPSSPAKDVDVEIGQKAAAEVRQQMPVVEDDEINNYLTALGRKLAASEMAGGFPYTFQGVADKNINAFALPGGPTFYNTGLFLNADNEGQLVGVMAHEISHVALRHGISQMQSAQKWGGLAQVLGAVGQAMGGIGGAAAQIGAGLGANLLLTKYSRNAERDSDLYGAQIMAQAGYNPLEMANFFEKLEKAAGKGASGAAALLQSHPNPGNRVKSVSAILPDIPYKNFNANSGQFERIKAKIQGGKFKAKAAAQPGQAGGPTPTGPIAAPSSRFVALNHRLFKMQHPENWRPMGDQNNPGVTIAPENGAANGHVVVGVMTDLAQGLQGDLRQQTQALINTIGKSNPSLKLGNNKQIQVNGTPAMMVEMFTDSAAGGKEHDILVAMQHPQGLFYLVFVSPESQFNNLRGVFDQILQSFALNR
jgi:beta-barrel assembly-enhancing protease